MRCILGQERSRFDGSMGMVTGPWKGLDLTEREALFASRTAICKVVRTCVVCVQFWALSRVIDLESFYSVWAGEVVYLTSGDKFVQDGEGSGIFAT